MTNHKTTGELFNEEYQSQKQEIIQKFKSESIKDHKWISDSNMGEANISVLECDDNSITLSVGHPDECFNSSLYRADAIAIAKHFNLIPETESTSLPRFKSQQGYDAYMQQLRRLAEGDEVMGNEINKIELN